MQKGNQCCHFRNVSIKEFNLNEHGVKLKATKIYSDIRNTFSKNPIPVNIVMKKENLGSRLTSFLTENSKIKESEVLLREADELRGLFSKIDSKDSLTYATDRFKLFRSEVAATGYASKATTDKISGLVKHISKVGSLFGAASFGFQKYKQSIHTLRDMSTILTDIISCRNYSALTDIAGVARISASYVAEACLTTNQLTAAAAIMIAVTKRSNSEVGQAIVT